MRTYFVSFESRFLEEVGYILIRVWLKWNSYSKSWSLPRAQNWRLYFKKWNMLSDGVVKRAMAAVVRSGFIAVRAVMWVVLGS
jgi:hypothetical protein